MDEVDSLHYRPERPVHYTHTPSTTRWPNMSLCQVGVPAETDDWSSPLSGIVARQCLEEWKHYEGR